MGFVLKLAGRLDNDANLGTLIKDYGDIEAASVRLSLTSKLSISIFLSVPSF
jgi:hypothetical protein